MTTLDDTITEFDKPDYCKIDVEGYELNLLRGLTQPITLISLEYHLTEREIETTRACLDYLAQFGELHINLAPSHLLEFAFDRWLSQSEFFAAFPEGLPKRDGYFYGDIFIRTTANK